jgi:hypothetical protein
MCSEVKDIGKISN